MSEAELHLLKQRIYQGILQKARRGARLFRGAAEESLLHHYATLFRHFFELVQISQECWYIVVFEFDDNGLSAFLGRHPFD